MTVFKIRKQDSGSREPQLHEDPFELFQGEDFAVEPDRAASPEFSERALVAQNSVVRPSRSAGGARPLPRSLRRLISWTGVVAAAAAAIVTLVTVRDLLSGDEPLPSAYFEVRAVDTLGHPIAGAVVRNNGRKVGVTDSFGEWRRFMRVTPGSTVAFELVKNQGGEELFASRNFAVPLRGNSGRDIVIQGSVELAAGRRRAASVTPALPVMPVADRDATASDAAAASTAQPAVDPTKAQESAPAEATSFSRISFAVDPATAPNLRAQSAAVVAALKTRAGQLGLAVVEDAKWKVSVQGLVPRTSSVSASSADSGSAGASSGLILINSSLADASHTASFLRNWEATPVASARSILHILGMHAPREFVVTQRDDGIADVNTDPSARLWALTPGSTLVNASGRRFVLRATGSGSPGSGRDGVVGQNLVTGSASERVCPAQQKTCLLFIPGIDLLPPVPQWQRLTLGSLKLPENVAAAKDVQVFVSGYLARFAGRGRWEYWGEGQATPNVTVVRAGAVVWRGKVADGTSRARLSEKRSTRSGANLR